MLSSSQIEPEVMCRLINDNCIREISNLDLLDSQTTVGSLSENDKYSFNEIKQFWSNLKNIWKLIVTEFNLFTKKMLNPNFNNMVLSKLISNLMIKYYIAIY